MGKRTFTAEYKTQVVLEELREEKQLGEIALEHGISPNQLRNWKREFLEKATRVFNESKREKDIRVKEKELEAERAELPTTIGQLTMERESAIKNRLDYWHTKMPYLGVRKLRDRPQNEGGIKCCWKLTRP